MKRRRNCRKKLKLVRKRNNPFIFQSEMFNIFSKNPEVIQGFFCAQILKILNKKSHPFPDGLNKIIF